MALEDTVQLCCGCSTPLATGSPHDECPDCLQERANELARISPQPYPPRKGPKK